MTIALNSTQLADAKTTLIQTAKRFYDKGWMPGTSGNMSIRLPGSSDAELPVFVITASGRNKGALGLNDFVVMNSHESESGKKSSAETLLHQAIYSEYPDVQAVYHVHTVAATVLSMRVVPVPGFIEFSGLEMMKGIGCSTHDCTIRLPVLPNTQDIAELSTRLSPYFEPDVPGFLLQGHGIYTWGQTPFDAWRHVEIWDFLFQQALCEMSLPGRG